MTHTIVDANNDLTTEVLYVENTDVATTQKAVKLADGLNPEEVLAKTPTDSFGYSLQPDGSYLIGINMSQEGLKIKPEYLREKIDKFSILANIQDPDHKEQIIQNTLDFYSKALGNVPPDIQLKMYFYDSKMVADFTVVDATPGSPTNGQVMTRSKWGSSNANASGKEMATVIYKFVDDDNNGSQVGSNVIKRR